MCTIGAVACGNRTFVLKNFDFFRKTPVAWAFFRATAEGYDHFALVDHAQQGVNSGMNSAGLVLVISSSGKAPPTPETTELRTILNADVLSRFCSVPDAVAYTEQYARSHPEMFGGNVILADQNHISVTEYFGGDSRTVKTNTGHLCRANHSCLGLLDNGTQSSEARLREMEDFLADIELHVPDLDRPTIVDRCKCILRRGPILNELTLGSLVFDVQRRTMFVLLGPDTWREYHFGESA